MRTIYLILFSTVTFISCEKPIRETVIISGKIGFIDEKYYEIDNLRIDLEDLQGTIDYDISYPQMYRFLLESDSGKYPFNKGFLFIDPETEVVKIDTLFNACPIYEYTDSNHEYRHKFIPFYYKSSFANCSNIINNVYVFNKQDDANLNTYIVKNPNSYVALWHLIERVSELGYKDIRRTALNNFSDQLKSSKIWKLLKDDLDRLELYDIGKVLPSITVKDSSLTDVNLDFSKLKSEYTLIEFWFSRCKPCHYKFKKLIPLQETYKERFDVINISTDPTKDIPLWQKELKKYNFKWVNYLDENEKEATKMNINSYPHSFLLNKNGEIILIDPSTKELENFLKQNVNL